MNKKTIVSPLATQQTKTARCIPPWYVQDTEYPPEICTYEPLVNGKEAFGAVYEAIYNAKKTVDIICWGFQPSMYFIRDKGSLRIGELLMSKAREGVEVRVLGWEYPFNAAGFAGEANLPGKGPHQLFDRAGQVSTDAQYDYDRWWFAVCTHDGDANYLLNGYPVPRFISRGFSAFERAEIMYQAKFKGLDPDLSASTISTMGAAPSHHQKTVLVDYNVPDRAVGFVMGHNMLDEYWDTDEHSAKNRTPETKPAPNAGPRGDTPRQDISCQISGPILEHLHHNFAVAWLSVAGQDLLKSRNAKHVGPQLQCLPGKNRQLAQLLRTQPQEGKRDIESVYTQAVNNAVRFIYIENQYFRWPPLAELIKKVARNQTEWGRDPGVHGALHLFVTTNVSDDGIGAGTVNTQRMLESLGRADTIPELTKLQRIKKLKENASPLNDPRDRVEQIRRDREIDDIKTHPVAPVQMPNLKVHICSLVAPDSPAGAEWMPVYIHSKLMIVDDVFTTQGSANINARSMQVDSEMNIAHEWADVSKNLRKKLWNLHTSKLGGQDDPAVAFEWWQFVIDENKKLQKNRSMPCASLVEFNYKEAVLQDLD